MPDDTVSTSQVKSARSKVDRLNEQIAAEKLKLAQTEDSATNSVVKAKLDNEAERLQAELDALKARNKEADKIIKNQVDSVATSTEATVLQTPADVAAATREGDK